MRKAVVLPFKFSGWPSRRYNSAGGSNEEEREKMEQGSTEGQSIQFWDCLCCSPLCRRSRLLDCFCCSLLGCCHFRFWHCCCGPNRLCCVEDPPRDPRSEEDVCMSSSSGEHTTGRGASSAKGVSTKTSEKQQTSSVTTMPAQKTRRYGTVQPPNPPFSVPTADVVTVQAGGESPALCTKEFLCFMIIYRSETS